MSTLVHLVYIHGFQGNDTTFQSFPKHLQERLASKIPSNLDIKIQTSLYPTYKSVKPISFATKNFLEWLSTQPEGPVILMAHSMGGLLAAEAATDPSNKPYRSPGGRPRRIVGVIAFDTPYLGMHPHVVITGLSSLLPKGGDKDNKESESAMNDHPQVQIVDEKVTDDWEAFKRQMDVHPRNAPYTSDTVPFHLSTDEAPGSSRRLCRTPSPSPNFMDNALSFIATQNDQPLVRWLRKHADEPFAAAKRWVVEHFQFGICMFDPAGLKTRYTHLIEWESEGGLWVNYWTRTIPQRLVGGAASTSALSVDAEPIDNDPSPSYSNLSVDIDTAPDSPAEPVVHTALTKTDANTFRKQEQKLLRQQEKQFKQDEKEKAKLVKKQEKEKNRKPKPERHFVILPNGLGEFLGGMDKWEYVPIAGVEDEVTAHTGLFIPAQNLEYDALVDRVAERVLGWCDRLPQVKHVGQGV